MTAGVYRCKMSGDVESDLINTGSTAQISEHCDNYFVVRLNQQYRSGPNGTARVRQYCRVDRSRAERVLRMLIFDYSPTKP